MHACMHGCMHGYPHALCCSSWLCLMAASSFLPPLYLHLCENVQLLLLSKFGYIIDQPTYCVIMSH